MMVKYNQMGYHNIHWFWYKQTILKGQSAYETKYFNLRIDIEYI